MNFSKNGYQNNRQRNIQGGQNSTTQLKIDENVTYINPYNFITLPKECKRKSEKEQRGYLTGYMDCVLTAKTPIFVPDTEQIEKPQKFKFFNERQKDETQGYTLPVIPGSEIRGMLRSDYETFTDSCMSTLNKDTTLVARSKQIKNPGILEKDENGKWHLYEAERYLLHTCRKGEGTPREAYGRAEAIYLVNEKNRIQIGEKQYETGNEVLFQEGERGIGNQKVLKIGQGSKKGILFIGESNRNKKFDSIFVKKNQELRVKNLEESIEGLKVIKEVYNDKAFNQKIREKNGEPNKTWYAGYDLEKKKVLPVWYSSPDNEQRTYLSLASIGKEAYHRKLHELVGEFMPCIDRNHLCKACNLFGFVAEEAANTSKIRIGDASYVGKENPYEKSIVIQELASPHITNAAFYALYTPNTDFENLPQTFDFNYDYKTEKGRNESIPEKEISIRGRKMYWHHTDIGRSIVVDQSKITERNCEIQPVKVNTQFQFKIYFNHVKEEDLQELIAVINLEDEKRELCHKIGKAKPLRVWQLQNTSTKSMLSKNTNKR